MRNSFELAYKFNDIQLLGELLWDSTVLYQSLYAGASEYLYDHLLQMNNGLVLHIDRDLPTDWSEKGFTSHHSKSYI